MKTALVIEDHQEIRENTVEILELGGLKVSVADNGTDGTIVAGDIKPDVILCDIMMPGLNGYEVIKVLKRNPTTSNIPFIYITASGERSEIKMAMDLGADGFVRKPFDIRELMQTIESALKSRNP
jgi:CheY-like chemotaxis protein